MTGSGQTVSLLGEGELRWRVRVHRSGPPVGGRSFDDSGSGRSADQHLEKLMATDSDAPVDLYVAA